jgi:hypothetical protein
MKSREEALVLKVLSNQYTAAKRSARQSRNLSAAKAKQDYRDRLISIKHTYAEAHQEYLAGNWEIFGMVVNALKDESHVNESVDR